MAKLSKSVRAELDANMHLGRWASIVRDLPPAQRADALRYVTKKRVGTDDRWWGTDRRRRA